MEIPDELSRDLSEKFPNLGRAALEAFAAEGYSHRLLSIVQVRKLLGFESKWEAQAFLSQHGVWPGQSAEQIMEDAASAAAFRGSSLAAS